MLRYTNGLSSSPEHKRLFQPEPEPSTDNPMTLNYAAANGYCQPDAMSSDKSGNSVSAGMLVEKGVEKD